MGSDPCYFLTAHVAKYRHIDSHDVLLNRSNVPYFLKESLESLFTAISIHLRHDRSYTFARYCSHVGRAP